MQDLMMISVQTGRIASWGLAAVKTDCRSGHRPPEANRLPRRSRRTVARPVYEINQTVAPKGRGSLKLRTAHGNP